MLQPSSTDEHCAGFCCSMTAYMKFYLEEAKVQVPSHWCALIEAMLRAGLPAFGGLHAGQKCDEEALYDMSYRARAVVYCLCFCLLDQAP